MIGLNGAVSMRMFAWTIGVVMGLLLLLFNLTMNLNAGQTKAIESRVCKEDIDRLDSRTAAAVRDVETRVTEHIKRLDSRLCDLEKKQDRNTENFNTKLDRILLQGKGGGR